MSDFLADIAERSLTTEQAIRPRPVSVFEPFQATGSVGFAQPPEMEQGYRISGPDALETISTPPVAMTARGRSAGQGAAHTTAGQAPALGVSTATADPQPIAGSQAPPGRVTSTGPKPLVDETISPPFEMEVRRKRPYESPDGHQTVTPSRPPAKEDGIETTGRWLGDAGTRSKVAGSTSGRGPLKPTIERVDMGKAVAFQLPRQPIAPLQSRLETIPGAKDGSLQKEKPTPTIHVTIGRIEVRAMPAPVENQHKPRSPRAMGLDEYLRRRTGGGR